MSAIGTKLTWQQYSAMSAFGGKADIGKPVVFRVLPPALLHRLIVLAGALTPFAGWEFQLRWKKKPKPSLPQSLPLATRTLTVGRRIKKPPWGWLLSTATNSVL